MVKSNLNSVLIGVGVFIILWLLWDRENKKDRIRVLEEKIEKNNNFNLDIKDKLKDLIENNMDIDEKTSNELKQISSLLEMKLESKALMSLAKIIENLLKKLYKGNPKLKEIADNHGRKKPVFADYLELAQVKGDIKAEDYHLLSVLKFIRNEEAHELDVQKGEAKVAATFVSGISTILKLTRIHKLRSVA